MNRNDTRVPEDTDEDDGESHAADEPTAVWDESALRAAGLNALLDKRRSDPPPPPATPAGSADRPSIEVSEELARAAATGALPSDPDRPPAELASVPAPQGGLGWAATVSIAVLLGALVYLAIRLAKG